MFFLFVCWHRVVVPTLKIHRITLACLLEPSRFRMSVPLCCISDVPCWALAALCIAVAWLLSPLGAILSVSLCISTIPCLQPWQPFPSLSRDYFDHWEPPCLCLYVSALYLVSNLDSPFDRSRWSVRITGILCVCVDLRQLVHHNPPWITPATSFAAESETLPSLAIYSGSCPSHFLSICGNLFVHHKTFCAHSCKILSCEVSKMRFHVQSEWHIIIYGSVCDTSDTHKYSPSIAESWARGHT